jgi:hypothetical protein
MRTLLLLIIVSWLFLGMASAFAQDVALEGLLRAQVFNKEFEGFDFYHVVIEEDHSQSDGSREVLAVASGKFSGNLKRLKVLFLIVDDHILGGQVLEGTGLPPCLAPVESRSSAL